MQIPDLPQGREQVGIGWITGPALTRKSKKKSSEQQLFIWLPRNSTCFVYFPLNFLLIPPKSGSRKDIWQNTYWLHSPRRARKSFRKSWPWAKDITDRPVHLVNKYLMLRSISTWWYSLQSLDENTPVAQTLRRSCRRYKWYIDKSNWFCVWD